LKLSEARVGSLSSSAYELHNLKERRDKFDTGLKFFIALA